MMYIKINYKYKQLYIYYFTLMKSILRYIGNIEIEILNKT